MTLRKISLVILREFLSLTVTRCRCSLKTRREFSLLTFCKLFGDPS